jgi:hypothetical protein
MEPLDVDAVHLQEGAISASVKHILVRVRVRVATKNTWVQSANKVP